MHRTEREGPTLCIFNTYKDINCTIAESLLQVYLKLDVSSI